MSDLSPTVSTRPSSSRLQHHFDDFEQQRESASLGMWVFIVQEVMFFGGLFAVYVLLRRTAPEAMRMGSHELDLFWGSFNTVVLIASSLTMALAVRAAQLARRKATVGFLLGTIVLGTVFLGVKAIEYGAKFEHHLFPGPTFHWEGPNPEKVEAFFSLYFAMTGLHALHMVVGIGVLVWLLFPAWKGVFDADYHNPVEGVGLYWHFVDIIWIFLFPLLYLLGRH